MGLNKYRLGELIELVVRQNTKLEYGVDDVRGVSNMKGMIATKADMSSRSLAPFYIIEPGEFVFNRRTTRNGERLGMAFNDTERAYIFTNDYVAFRVRESACDLLSAEYLYMFFCRDEFDRYVRVHSWGSATEFFNWDDMCEVEIELPPLAVQQKYVAVYRAILANQQSYEHGIDELKTVIDATLDRIKHEAPRRKVGSFFAEVDERNSDGAITEAMGINIEKRFMRSNLTAKDLHGYKLVRQHQFAYSSMQTGRDECIRIALQQADEPLIVSPAYNVLEVTASDVLPEYIMMWFSRAESDRYGAFLSDGSIRANLDLERFYNIEIPIPDVTKQRALANLYTVYSKRRQLAERLQAQLAHLCPILIRGAMDEAARA